MIVDFTIVIASLAVLVWSAGRFVEGGAATARHFGVSPLLIGMLILGFGTSAPEMIVSAISAFQGNPGIALGNAYGSNITNIAMILGITALINPITVHSGVLKKELPILSAVTIFAAYQLYDGKISRTEAWVLLGIFAFLMTWTIIQGVRQKNDTFGNETELSLSEKLMTKKKAFLWLISGLLILIASSRSLVWAAVNIAQSLGVDDVIIGLTIVAIGTSLPELASSVVATRKGEHDIAIGNIIGSNLFNTLAVVGIAGAIHPLEVAREIFYRDMMVMGALTLSLFIIGYGIRGPGKIKRVEGGILLASYIAYNLYLVLSVIDIGV